MNKYHNIKKRCLSRHFHASKFESEYCNRLLAMKQNKEIKDYKIQVSFDLDVNHQHICRHVVDFVVIQNNDRMEIHEAKGYVTDTFRIKRALFEVIYPDLKYLTIYKKERRPKCQKKLKGMKIFF